VLNRVYTKPLEEGVSPRRPFNKVLLPDPTGPIMKQNCFRLIVKVLSQTIGNPSSVHEKLAFCTVIMVAEEDGKRRSSMSSEVD